MIFPSYTFLFLFLPTFLLAHSFMPPAARNGVLLLGSYVFYAWWRADFALLLVASTVIDYSCGQLIHASSTDGRRRAFVTVSILANLSLLAYFKYANWGIENLNVVLRGLGLVPVRWVEIVLPVGLSFFTFQTMSYSIDVYRRTVEPARNLVDFATYVAMFPQLVAGPIVRYGTVAAQLADRTLEASAVRRGALLFAVGFSKKVLLANNYGVVADSVFDAGPTGFLSAWLGLLAFTYQIYFDFSGYSDMAIGVGAMLGFSYPRNFDSPYRAQSITEFWRRWHISLTTWIRDYLYIPLGGNRGGAMRTLRNLAVAMLLCGLWHGASWTFVAWGGYHAALLVSERMSDRKPLYARLPQPIRVVLTMALVMVGWLLFRSESLGDFARFFGLLVDPSSIDLNQLNHQLTQPLTYVLLVAGTLIVYRATESITLSSRASLRTYGVQVAVFGWAIVELFSQRYNPFIYFQF